MISLTLSLVTTNGFLDSWLPLVTTTGFLDSWLPLVTTTGFLDSCDIEQQH